MRLDDFRRMVQGMAAEVPPAYLDGITAIEVSPRAIPHPTRGGIFTMGECVPLEAGGGAPSSRVTIYHGSFKALAAGQPGFDWRAEAWETLTHELKHHLEWRANAADLDRYDWASEQAFARESGEPYDPVFYLFGERMAPDLYQVEDDVFFDRPVRRRPESAELAWNGRRFRVTVPRLELPIFLALRGLPNPPAGDAFVVVRHRPRIRDLFRKTNRPNEADARVERLEP